MLHLDGIRVNEYLENQAGSKEKLYIHSITLSGSQGSIIETEAGWFHILQRGNLLCQMDWMRQERDSDRTL